MTVEKQREVIRLWNELRKLEGPAAEELRIQSPGMLFREGQSQARGLTATGESRDIRQARSRSDCAPDGPGNGPGKSAAADDVTAHAFTDH